MVCTQRCATFCFFAGDHNDIDLRTRKERISKALSLGIYVLHLDALHACLQRYAKSARLAMDALLVNVIRNPLHLAQRAARARFLDCSFHASGAKKHHLQICLDDLSFLCASFLCCRRSYFLRAYFSNHLCACRSLTFSVRASCGRSARAPSGTRPRTSMAKFAWASSEPVVKFRGGRVWRTCREPPLFLLY